MSVNESNLVVEVMTKTSFYGVVGAGGMVLCHSVYGPCECEWVWLSPAAGADAADSQLAKYDCW